MSLCSSCGHEVRWAKRTAGRTHPPLEYLGNVLIVDHRNVVEEVAGYKQHICDPEEMAAWENYRNQATEQRIDYLEQVQRAQEASRVVMCRKCGADIDVACKNLHARRKGNFDVDNVWPHKERLDDVGWKPEETVGPPE